MLVPASVSVPPPVLTNWPDDPLTVPFSVRLVPVAVLTTAALLRTTERPLLNVAVAAKVPLLMVSAPDASPRLPSWLTWSVPLIVHGVTPVVVPVSVQTPVPLAWKPAKFRYWAAAPIADTSKLELVLPPNA